MFDKEAIEALQEGASIEAAYKAVKDAIEMSAGAAVALPSEYTLHDLEKFLPNRRRARGIMSTSNVASFVNYTEKYAELGACVFVDSLSMRAVSVLNLGADQDAGHADNKAELCPEKTAAFKALQLVATGAGKSQKDVAEFLEDWPSNIKCFNDDGEITRPLAIAAIRKLTIESMRKIESEEKQLSSSKSAFESVQATSSNPLPTTIYFDCQPYTDLPTHLFVLRLGVLTGDATPKVNLRIVKAEEHQEEMAKELVNCIKGDMSTPTIPVLIGSYTRSN